jgi:hypothetical protein
MADPTDPRYSSRLRADLSLAPAQIHSFAEPFGDIARHFKASASVSSDDCDKLKTVGDACELVAAAAGMGKTQL